MTKRRTQALGLLLSASAGLAGCGGAPSRFGSDFGGDWIVGGVDSVWSQDIGSVSQQFELTVVDGQVCVANEDGLVSFLDVNDGSLISSKDLNRRLLAGGACSADRYAGLTPDYRVGVFDLNSGEVRWQVALTGNLLSAPLLAGNTLLLFQSNGLVRGHSFFSGDELWLLELASSDFRLAGNFTPMVDGTVVYFGMPEGSLYSVEYLDGIVLGDWRLFDARERDPTANLSNVGGIALNKTTFCASAFNGKLACFDRASGRQIWRTSHSTAGNIAAGDGVMYFIDSAGALVAVAVRDGEVLWQVDGASRNRTAKVVYHKEFVVVDNGFGGISTHAAATGEQVGGSNLAGHVLDVQQVDGDLIVLTTAGTVVRLSVGS